MTATSAERETPVAELRHGDAAVRVAATAGAPIVSYIAAGREWCAQPWMEYAPVVRACTVPSLLGSAYGTNLEDGGTLARELPELRVHADGTHASVSAKWLPGAYPMQWVRTVALEADGSLRVQTTAENAGRAPLPFTWGLSIVVDHSADARLELPSAGRARVAASSDDDAVRSGTEFVWPTLRVGAHAMDCAEPKLADLPARLVCCAELSRPNVNVQVAGTLLELKGDASIVSHARVTYASLPEIKHRWWSTAAARTWWRTRRERRLLTVALAVGDADTLSDAVGGVRKAKWLNPGERATWSVWVRARVVE
jgi:hypothetical protein